jgi:hypothetical protein
MNPADFSEYYKTLSTLELLIILENPGDYQLPALEAAKREMQNRELSPNEINAVKEQMEAARLQKEKQKEKVKVIEDTIKKAGNTIIDTLNPIQSGIPTTDKLIRFIVIAYGGIFIFQLLTETRSIIATVKDIADYPVETIFYLLPFVILPVGLFYFWKRKKRGWVLLGIFITYFIVHACWMLYEYFTWTSSGNEFFDMLLPVTSPVSSWVQLLVLGGTLFVICKREIREIYKIDKQSMLLTILPAGLLVLFILFNMTQG